MTFIVTIDNRVFCVALRQRHAAVADYRIAGQLRESLMGVVLNMTRVAVIVSVAASMSIGSTNLHDLFAGSSDCIPDSINKNLVYTVAAMGAIDAVQAPTNDVATATQKARAADLAIFGTASPPMAVGAMLLMYNSAIALVVGLGPLFILCLIFDQTKPLFQKWLMYGIVTLFSMGMLAFISSLVLQLTLRVAGALWSADVINGITGIGAEGFTSQSMQQAGPGLLMTLLVISVPPMAGNFFSATLGNFSPYNVFSPRNQPGANGQPAGAFGHGGHGQLAYQGDPNSGKHNAGAFNKSASPSSTVSNGALLGKSGYTQVADVTKQGGGLASPPAGW